jgi:hypothetical protein
MKMGVVRSSETSVKLYRATRHYIPEYRIFHIHCSESLKSNPVWFGETVAVYCENHTEHINTLCGQIAEFLNAAVYGTYSYHCAIEG